MLISYDAQNLNHFYKTINTSLRNYLDHLHSRIPQRIVPLIWNDPVMQKLAMVISSSKKFRQKKAKTPATQLTGLYQIEPRLDLQKSINNQQLHPRM